MKSISVTLSVNEEHRYLFTDVVKLFFFKRIPLKTGKIKDKRKKLNSIETMIKQNRSSIAIQARAAAAMRTKKINKK